MIATETARLAFSGTEAEGQAWLVLAFRISGISGRRCQRLVACFGSAQAALNASPREWAEVVGKKVGQARPGPADWQWAATQWRLLQAQEGRLLTMVDADYPALFHQIASPPPVLFVLGDLKLNLPCVAIVGPRTATAYGLSVARQLARGLAEAGVCVVSGMAAGVDAAAHQGALIAGGQTIAALGCGVDVPYPASSVELHRQIRRRGAVISEFPMGSRPEPGWFPRRNRLISGLSLGVVVVEAPARSGSLITAAHAIEQNREVFAVPGSVLDGQSAGCHRLLREGAVLVEGVDDILGELQQWGMRPAKAERRPAPSLTGSEQHLYELLEKGPRHIDQLAEATQLPAADLLSALLRLELDGKVVQLPGKWFAWAEG